MKNGKVRFRLNIDVRNEMEDSRLNAIRQLIMFVKFRPNFSSKSTTEANVHLTESVLLDNWLKNNNTTLGIMYYLQSHFVSLFFKNVSFQIYFSTAEKTKENLVATR